RFFIVILGTIWLCDSFAYFLGIALGRHKLAPRTSPNKTWEGAIAGYIGAVLSFSILNWIFRLNLPFAYQLLFASIVGVVGQIGDLAESKIKREFNVKDSSAILPGHGGFLDRLDSIMFVFPAILLVVILLLKF
ncbi:MAG: phosphatidate cytidylyltransferase, partial [Candidatus Kapaibacteriota bacterium]